MQSRGKSLVEVVLSTATGFVLSYLSWLYVLPWVFGIETHAGRGVGVILYFTTLSILRGYIWRRSFNGKETE